MISTNRNSFFGRNRTVNLILGGLGVEITTREALATTLGILRKNIRKFTLVGNDIHCYIRGDWSLSTQLLQGNTNLTSFIDLKGMVIGLQQNSLKGIPNLVELRVPNAGLGNGSVADNPNLTNLNTEGTLTIRTFSSTGCLQNCGLKKIIVTQGTSITNGCLSNCPNLEEIIMPNLDYIYNDGLDGTPVRIMDLSKVTHVGNRAMRNTNLEYAYFNSLVTTGTVNFIANSPLLKELHMPVIESILIDSTCFNNLTSCELISMKKLKVYRNSPSGITTATNAGFGGLKTGCIIEVHEALATADNGSPHSALVWVKNNRSAIVKFYDDNGNYVSTL